MFNYRASQHFLETRNQTHTQLPQHTSAMMMMMANPMTEIEHQSNSNCFNALCLCVLRTQPCVCVNIFRQIKSIQCYWALIGDGVCIHHTYHFHIKHLLKLKLNRRTVFVLLIFFSTRSSAFEY